MRFVALTIALALASGCDANQTGFTGRKSGVPPAPAPKKPKEETDGGNKRPGTDDATPETDLAQNQKHVIEIPCADGDGMNPDPVVYEHPGSAADRFTVKASFCPKGRRKGKVRVLFVVDASGSMADNDPVKGGSCGRLAAAQAVVGAVKKGLKEGDVMEVGVVSFASRANVESELVTGTAALTAAAFCKQEDQTNYKAGFEAARGVVATAMQKENVPVTTYLLSDGLPNLGTEESDADFAKTETDGADAAKRLADEGATLNAVFLAPDAEIRDHAVEYLTKVTGDAARVRITESASDLASKITELQIPAPTLVSESAEAVLEASGHSDILDVEVTGGNAGAGQAETVTVATKEFSLAKSGKVPQKAVVRIRLRNADGQWGTATAILQSKAGSKTGD